MSKALSMERIIWSSCVCQGHLERHRQISIPIQEKGDKRECINYHGKSRLSLHGKVYATCFERSCQINCGWRISSPDFFVALTSRPTFHSEKSWEYANVALTILKKGMTGFHNKKALWIFEVLCCWWTLVAGHQYTCMLAKKFVFH